jgi:hypothetical protein
MGPGEPEKAGIGSQGERGFAQAEERLVHPEISPTVFRKPRPDKIPFGGLKTDIKVDRFDPGGMAPVPPKWGDEPIRRPGPGRVSDKFSLATGERPAITPLRSVLEALTFQNGLRAEVYEILRGLIQSESCLGVF